MVVQAFKEGSYRHSLPIAGQLMYRVCLCCIIRHVFIIKYKYTHNLECIAQARGLTDKSGIDLCICNE